MTDFLTTDYLACGNKRQRLCHHLLASNGIMEHLADYTPVVVGTIPINIDVPNSDMDIICRTKDFEAFERLLCDKFRKYGTFFLEKHKDNISCSFEIENQQFEIYAEDIPVHRQNAYRHMLIEYRILNLLGESFRRLIVELKLNGLKTEPAFASLLKLHGNPFSEILTLENFSDTRIKDLFFRK